MSINFATYSAKFEADLSGLQKGFNEVDETIKSKLGNSMKSVGGKIEGVGKSLSKISIPLIAMGAAAIKVGSDFQAAMSEVAAISGATGNDLDRLTEKAKEMGKSTKFSASESANALKYMAMAGWDTNQMLDGLEGVMMLAAASGEDLALTSDIVTDALTAFGMKASEASNFADLLASASSNSNTNVSMLGESFKYVAPLFGSLGYSAEDAALALGLMANAGIKGSQAGTALKTAIANLANPTDKMKAAMNDLGVSITDASGEMLPFQDVMVQLRQKFAGLTEEQKVQYAATMFGKEAMSGMLAIINASDEDFAKLTDATREYTGTAKEMANIMEDNLQGQITKLKSALEGLGIEIFEVLLPHLNSLVEKLQGLVEWFANLNPETQELIIKIGLLAAAIGPVVALVGSLAAAIGFLLTPVGAAVAAIAAMIAIGVLLWQNWDTIKEKAGQLKDAISERWNNIKSKTSETWNNVKTNISKDWNSIKTNTSETLSNIKSSISESWNNVKSKTSETWENMKSSTSSAWANIKGKINEHGGGIKGVIGTYTEAYKSVWSSTLNTMDSLTGGKFSSMLNHVKSKTNDIKNNITNNIKSAMESWNSNTSSMLSNAQSKFSSMASAVSSAFSKVKDAIQSGINKIKDWNSQKAENKSATFTTTIREITEKVTNFITGNKTASYDVGSNFIPRDGLAYLHKGEAVIPAHINKAQQGKPYAEPTQPTTQTFNIAKLEFPNVRSGDEIEKSIRNLSWVAKQYVNR